MTDRERGNSDPRNSPGQELSAKQVSVVQVNIQLQGRNRILSQILHSFFARILKCGLYIHCSPLEDRGYTPCLAPVSSKMAWCGDQVKDQYTFSLSQKVPSNVKDFSYCVLLYSFLVFSIQVVLEVSLFHSYILFPIEILYCGFLICSFWKKYWMWTASFVQGYSHNYVESRGAQSGRSCHISKISRITGCLGNGIKHIEPWGPTSTLWD